MNLIESLEAYLAYKRYVTAHEAREDHQGPGGQGPAPQPQDPGPSAVYVPDAGDTRLPYYTAAGRWSTPTDGVVVEQAANGSLLAFRRNLDNTITLLELAGGQSATIAEGADHGISITLATGQQVHFVDDPGPALHEILADGQITFTENSDGTITSTESDGSTLTYYADGSRIWQGADGWTRRYDETGALVSATDPSGLTTVYASDTQPIVTLSSNGQRTDIQEDGSRRTVTAQGALLGLTLADGTAAAQDPDGTWAATDAAGASHHYAADGRLLSVTTAAGQRTDYLAADLIRVTDPDGAVRWEWADGVAVTRTAAGAYAAVDAHGTALTVGLNAQGLVQVLLPSGAARVVGADGSWSVEGLNGVRWVHQADGGLAVTLADGTVVQLSSTGALAHAQGNTPVVWALREFNGPLVIDAGNGVMVTVRSDGHQTATDANGVVDQRSADGTRTVTLPEGITITWVDGAPVAVDRTGQALQASEDADGLHVTAAGGLLITMAADGTVTRTTADGFRADVDATGARYIEPLAFGDRAIITASTINPVPALNHLSTTVQSTGSNEGPFVLGPDGHWHDPPTVATGRSGAGNVVVTLAPPMGNSSAIGTSAGVSGTVAAGHVGVTGSADVHVFIDSEGNTNTMITLGASSAASTTASAGFQVHVGVVEAQGVTPKMGNYTGNFQTATGTITINTPVGNVGVQTVASTGQNKTGPVATSTQTTVFGASGVNVQGVTVGAGQSYTWNSNDVPVAREIVRGLGYIGQGAGYTEAWIEQVLQGVGQAIADTHPGGGTTHYYVY